MRKQEDVGAAADHGAVRLAAGGGRPILRPPIQLWQRRGDLVRRASWPSPQVRSTTLTARTRPLAHLIKEERYNPECPDDPSDYLSTSACARRPMSRSPQCLADAST